MDILTSAYLSLRDRLQLRAQRITGRADEAEDALQEAFYRLWSRQYDIRSEGQAEALLHTAVRNASVDQVRRRRDALPLESADTVPGRPEPKDSRETLALVRGIIESALSPTQRYILERKEYEGIPLETIAEELGMQPGTVRVQLSRARKTIREIYRRTEHEK